MTRDEARAAMIKGVPVVWNGGGTAVQSNITYAFISSVGERYDHQHRRLIEVATLIDKNSNSALQALVEDIRLADTSEVLAFHGFRRT